MLSPDTKERKPMKTASLTHATGVSFETVTARRRLKANGFSVSGPMTVQAALEEFVGCQPTQEVDDDGSDCFGSPDDVTQVGSGPKPALLDAYVRGQEEMFDAFTAAMIDHQIYPPYFGQIVTRAELPATLVQEIGVAARARLVPGIKV
jgi:hypothetical protein